MAFSADSGGRRAMAEINVTPLVDVMLVLLIIFMVTAPLIQTGVKVDLPQVKTPPVEVKQEKLVLSIKKEANCPPSDYCVYLADTRIPIKELHDKLTTNAKLKEDKELYLRADQSLPYGVIVNVMALARAAGVDSIGMVTDPPEVDK